MALISSYINKFKDVHILCVGDIMLDEFVYGSVKRISPEAPVPVFCPNKKKKMLGGAGNVAANLCSLGGKTTFIGVVGTDNQGKLINDKLCDLGATAHLIELSDWPTIIKTRLISGSTHLLRSDREEKLNMSDTDYDKLINVFTEEVKKADVVLLSDYNKGVLNEKTTPEIIKICNKFGKPVIVDPKGTHYEKYCGATLVKPNLKEFSEATGMNFEPTSADFHKKVSQGAKKLFQEHKIKNLIVTLSENGMLFVSAENPDDILQIPTVAKEVYDVSGAGDTSMATLGVAIGADMPIKDAMKLANNASGIVVGKIGTATVSITELMESVSENDSGDDWQQKRKIITLAKAKQIADNLREQGKVIGFTNGCYDCCHLGHLYSFVQAKKNCDVLFIGMNSDASVKRNKGPERPIQDEKTRAFLLASLEMVDYVIVFDDETALPLVDEIKPDVIAKEGYKIENWPEAQRVIELGGRAVELPRLDGYSTSTLFQKIKG
ncbi:MAG: D-glycero-beta-D-manno-heptose-7-phosphate kinase [Alphaproteobacteria bacterium]